MNEVNRAEKITGPIRALILLMPLASVIALAYGGSNESGSWLLVSRAAGSLPHAESGNVREMHTMDLDHPQKEHVL